MAIEYLLVTYPEQRAVLADGERVGFTNHTLMLPTDEYVITLDGAGYQPPSQDIALAGTSLVKPMVVPFLPTSSAGGPPPPSALATPTTRAQRARRRDA